MNENFTFQIIDAIGSLATFGAFIYLFKRDNFKQDQINKLTRIATVLETQNQTMQLQNDLISQQVDIFRNTSLLKGQDEIGLYKLIEIENKKLKLSIRPNLWLNGASYRGNDGILNIELNNNGEVAKLTEINSLSEEIILERHSLPFELNKSKNYLICARRSRSVTIREPKYEIVLIYMDKLENRYMIKIKGKGANVKIIENREI